MLLFLYSRLSQGERWTILKGNMQEGSTKWVPFQPELFYQWFADSARLCLFLRILDTYNVSMNPCLYLVSWFFLLQEGIVTRIIRNKTQSTSLLCLHVGNNSNSIYLLIMLAKAIKMNLQSAAQKIDDRNWPRAAESPNDSSFNLKYVVGNRPSG